MNQLQQQMYRLGIIPVVTIQKASDAVNLAGALCRGGLPCAEVTFRTEAAKDAIRAMTQAYPQMLVGAGTVLTRQQADDAIQAGAKFLVSPGLNPNLVSYCLEQGYPIIPGCATPSDVERAIELGLTAVKFFPAEAAGGLPMLKAMSAPYHQMKFMPTGGINLSNLNRYLGFSKIFACGGSWMVKEELIRSGDFAQIEQLTRQAVETMLDLKLDHIGVSGGEQAVQQAEELTALLGWNKTEGEKSFFAGSQIEIMKGISRGEKGHLGISTNSVERAQRYLESRGYTFDESTAVYTEQGEKRFIYLENSVAGFAVHLMAKGV
ncbi:MAG: bifunctional 4-hydroxy-2-oxoglutarate aldolase/2-dehydro-3-deoxy-phosphogluconate aldolase [Massiliimalia sp.]